LAPPLLAKKDKDGHLIKKAYGPGMMKLFGVLASLRFLRGTWFDPFGHTNERKTERALIDQYCQDVERMLANLNKDNLSVAVELASLPDDIRGYGHVKEAAIERASARRKTLLEAAAQSGERAKTSYYA
jgi:indolepyruvate ferredoxin oxidoreductase